MKTTWRTGPDVDYLNSLDPFRGDDKVQRRGVVRLVEQVKLSQRVLIREGLYITITVLLRIFDAFSSFGRWCRSRRFSSSNYPQLAHRERKREIHAAVRPMTARVAARATSPRRATTCHRVSSVAPMGDPQSH